MPLPKIYLDDDLFSTQEQRDDKLKEKVVNISLNDIDDFPKHPFKVIDNGEIIATSLVIAAPRILFSEITADSIFTILQVSSAFLRMIISSCDNFICNFN